MSNGKKSKLTVNKKLTQTLSLEDEWPYKIPENWRYCKIAGITTRIKRGKAPKYVPESDIPVFAQKCNQKDGTIAMEKAQFLNPEMVKKIADDEYLQDKDIVINSTGTGTLGRVGLYKNTYAFPFTKVLPDSHITVVRTEQYVKPKFLYYFLKSKQEYLEQSGVGTTNQKELRPEVIGEIAAPLPPFAEQERIVDRIERLFAKLDEAREKAQAVVDGFEERKAAILHRAFTGELTEKWRKQEGISFTTWKQVKVKDVCVDVKVGIVIKPSQYYTDGNKGTPAFRSANVREFHIDDSNWVFLSEDGMRTNQRSVVHTGDVLVVRSGNPGTACVVEEKFDGFNAIDILIAVPNKEMITSEFLCGFTNSPIGRNLVSENKRGMALTHFNVSGYSNLILPLPLIEEQNEIVGRLFALMKKEQQARETAEQVISQIDTMKKSILARAFRGELGTNDPTDESAEELLKRMLQEA